MKLAPIHVPELLHQYGLHPNKRLGQNFLVDEAALQRVVAVAEVGPGEAVLEIGPGLGSLTRYLACTASQVTAVELDSHLLPALRQVLAPYPNVRVVEGDILALDPVKLMSVPVKQAGDRIEPVSGGGGTAGMEYVVVANIPYYITSALIRHLLEARIRPRRLVLTVQREVANRICAQPGKMSLLALSVQVYGQPRVVAHIPADSFYPPPKVDSAVVRIDLHSSPLIPTPLIPLFFRLAKAGFSQKRKTLRNALSGGLACPPAQAANLLVAVGIDPQRRAETLSLAEWNLLTEKYQSLLPPHQ
jgi:16S rRNA (adenine1518-N6/adenine1519-N6)-dimethyltransferase